ncbi:MAG: hypothetical protein ACLSVD_03650 [Eggerthellaceae bacterium]
MLNRPLLYRERGLLQGRAKEDMMREMKAGEAGSRAVSATRLLEDLDEQWPSMKFLGWAYYAWIFLSYNNDVLFGWSGASVGGNAMSVMYLASTTALGLVLIVAGAFQKVTARIVESRLSVTYWRNGDAGHAGGGLVGAAQAGEALYVAGCSLTGWAPRSSPCAWVRCTARWARAKPSCTRQDRSSSRACCTSSASGCLSQWGC